MISFLIKKKDYCLQEARESGKPQIIYLFGESLQGLKLRVAALSDS